MKKTNENLAGVIGITNLARPHNQQIGNYIEHYINENFDYSVLLNKNGSIRMDEEQVKKIISEMVETKFNTINGSALDNEWNQFLKN